MIPRIALTSGEPAGIGPELCLALALEALPCELVCLADREMLSERATQLNLAVTLRSYGRQMLRRLGQDEEFAARHKRWQDDRRPRQGTHAGK